MELLHRPRRLRTSEAVREMAQRLGIDDCLDKYPYQLSGIKEIKITA